MQIEIPEFHSEELQQAAEFFGGNITQHKEKLDAISNDIKKIEKWFEDLGLRLEITEEFSRKVEEPPGEGGDGTQVKESESLSWALDEKTNKWRLCYIRTVENSERIGADDAKKAKVKHLSDAPVDVMIRAFKSIPAFLKRLDGSFRKRFRRSETGLSSAGQRKRTEVRPLIETPVDVRLRAFMHLPAFLKKAGKALEPRPVAQRTP